MTDNDKMAELQRLVDDLEAIREVGKAFEGVFFPVQYNVLDTARLASR